jgi:glycosyltransferase involved in cell wall biosynthesis
MDSRGRKRRLFCLELENLHMVVNHSKKIKVLFILTALYKDGAVLSTLTMIKHLNRSHFEPVLFVLKGGGKMEEGGGWKVLLEDIDVRYGLLPGEKILQNGLKLIRKLYSHVKHSEVIVGGLEMMPTFLAVLVGKLSGKPSVGFIRNSLPELLSVLPWHYKVLTKSIYPYLNRAVAISEGIKRGTEKLLPRLKDRISVVYIPIDLDQITALGQMPLHEADVLRPYLLAVGRLVPQKGFDILLEAYSLARKQGIKQRLVIVGEGMERKSLELLIDKLDLKGHVHLAGFRENPYAWMKNADMVISSSRFEGFCRVLAEAQALGTAVLSTNCPEGPAEVLEGGLSGMLVENENAQELAAAIYNLSSKHEIRNQLILRALERVQEFTLQNAINKFEEILFHLTPLHLAGKRVGAVKIQSGAGERDGYFKV